MTCHPDGAQSPELLTLGAFSSRLVSPGPLRSAGEETRWLNWRSPKASTSSKRFCPSPIPRTWNSRRRLDGDVIILGAGGKMGPTLAMRIERSLRRAGSKSRLIAVSTFSDEPAARRLSDAGIELIRADLLDDDFCPARLADLPRCPNVIFMAGMKFGATGQENLTWAKNAYLPGRVAEHYQELAHRRPLDGKCLPLVPAARGGSREARPDRSCRGVRPVVPRPGAGVRLFRRPALDRDLRHPPELRRRSAVRGAPRHRPARSRRRSGLGLHGLCQRDLAGRRQLGHLPGARPGGISLRDPQRHGQRKTCPSGPWPRSSGSGSAARPGSKAPRAETALLSDASRCQRRLGVPRVPLDWLLDLVADWVAAGRPTYAKPTKFEVRDGRF